MKLADALSRGVIRGYQLLVSPVLAPTCRYEPTCSAYALEAVSRFGTVRGGWLALKRLARCRPWGGAGFDPVPLYGPEPGCADNDIHAKPRLHARLRIHAR